MEIDKTCTHLVARSDNGFTLIELLIAMVVSGILMMAMIATFTFQQDIYAAQSQVTEVQQNARAAFWYMLPDMRMAGFDPTLDSDAAIQTATQGRFGFTMDVDDDDGTGEPDGDTDDANESVAFGFSNAYDPDGDGVIAGNGVAPLGRDTGGGLQPIIENISAVEFYYTLDDGTQSLAPADPKTIVGVDISILARTKHPDRKFTNNTVYTSASGANWGPYNDNYRRYLLISSVQLRNHAIEDL